MLVLLTLFLVALDQITKSLVRANLAPGESWAPIPALSRVFTITHVQNTGVAFGQMAGFGWLFMLVNLTVAVGIVVYYPRIPQDCWILRPTAALIMTGDLGNVIDRLRTAFFFARDTGSIFAALPHAYVTDFFDFKIWPVFNVADLCIVSGVTILAWTLWRSERAEMKKNAVTNDG